MGAVWTDDLRMPCFPPLWGQARTDVLIIGGGMTGLLCARMLQNAGVDCAVAEAASIAGGITKNTTAKITSQHGLIYQQLAKRFGTEKAALYLQANEQALAAFRTLCAGIDCDFPRRTTISIPPITGKSWSRRCRRWKALAQRRSLPKICRCHFPRWGR